MCIGFGYGRLGKVLKASHAVIISEQLSWGIQNVVLETNAPAMVEAVNAQVLDRSSASGLMRGIERKLVL